jgi:hypothetical protein
MSAIQADGEIQLANILVSIGQVVSQGDIIGYLYVVDEEYASLNFTLYENGNAICPEPYFTPEAKESILNLIHVVWPDADMCY